MRVVAEQERLAPPSLCFICESSPVRDVNAGFENVVDTQRDFNPPSLSHLSGRKYICERCVAEAANLLGFVRSDELDTINERLKTAREAVGRIAEFVKSLSSEAADQLGALADLVPAQVVSTPKDENVVEKEKE